MAKQTSKAIESLERAFSYSVDLLFNPFRLKYFLMLGLLVFLITLGQGGANFNMRVPTGGGEEGLSQADFTEFIQKISENLLLIVLIGVSVLLFILLLQLLFLYLSSAAQFLFLKGVTHRRVQLWRWLREEQPRIISFFLMRIVFTLIFLGLFLIFIGAPGLLIAGIINGVGLDQVGAAMSTGVILLVAVAVIYFLAIMILYLFLFLLVHAVLVDFVVPLMVSGNTGSTRAFFTALSLLRKNPSEAFIFYLLRVGIAFVVGFVLFFLGCFLTCICMIPAIVVGGLFVALFVALTAVAGSLGILSIVLAVPVFIIGFLLFNYVVALIWTPYYVFKRSYSIAFLGDLDPESNLFPRGFCPSCGAPVLDANVHYCHACGARLSEDRTGETPSPELS